MVTWEKMEVRAERKNGGRHDGTGMSQEYSSDMGLVRTATKGQVGTLWKSLLKVSGLLSP